MHVTYFNDVICINETEKKNYTAEIPHRAQILKMFFKRFTMNANVYPS